MNGKGLINSIEDLKRRIDITRRARFACSTRLRKYFNRIQNLIVYYNILVVFVSIVTLYQSYSNEAKWTTHLTLALSITLSFFATYIGGKNYNEKAIKMEHNGHELSRIYGKIIMLQAVQPISINDISKLYKEYERTLINVENHENVDYLNAKNMKEPLTEKEIKKVKKYDKKSTIKFGLAYTIPSLIAISTLIIPLINYI